LIRSLMFSRRLLMASIKGEWVCGFTSEMIGLRTCDTRLHVASEFVDWRADDDVGDVAPGQCSRPVPVLTCVAGNRGVRSSG
jgi:hypothetical protein